MAQVVIQPRTYGSVPRAPRSCEDALVQDSIMGRTLAIVGPTGSGKSEVALRIASELGGEIVSCDSVQVFRDFEIGCAKPTAAERYSVPHHLLDVVGWKERFDAQQYRTRALAALAEIRGRNRLAVICGGTGLYLRTLRYGLVEAPAADPALRAELMAEEMATPGSLYARLLRIDPETATTTAPQNLVRIVRALEIAQLTGDRASAVRARHGFAAEEVPLRPIYLQWPAGVLKDRIRRRSMAMLDGGLVEEVERLLAAGVEPDCRPMCSVGYREACAVVRGEATLDGLAERISQSTWAYARRQRTWFRHERGTEIWEVSNLGVAATRLLLELRAG